MTSGTLTAVVSPVSFEERLGILTDELELAVKWQRPCIVLVVYGSEYVRADVQAALENVLVDLGQKAVHVGVRTREPSEASSFFKEFTDPARSVFMVDGLRWGTADDRSAYATVGLQRDYFVERQVRVVVWLTANEIARLAHAAPDFWAYRQRVIEFVESPKAERVLRGASDSAWQGTGEYAAEDGDTDSRISMRERMLTELPEGNEALSIRGNLLLTLTVLHWRRGDFETADAQLQEALQIATRTQDNWFEAECFNARALIRSSTGEIDAAIEAYKRALFLAPHQIFVWNNLGNLCAKVNRNDEAMLAFRKSLEGNAKDPVAWNGLASLHFKLGSIDDAIAAYRRALQFSPAFAQPWCGLGDVYASIGRTDEALKCYHKAIDLNKKYVAPWMRLGSLFSRQERWRDAVKAYQKALELDDQDSDAWAVLGNAWLKCDAFEDAAGAFSRATELDRANGGAQSNLGFALANLGRPKEAVSPLLRSIELLASGAEKAASWNRLAAVYGELGDQGNAAAAFQMARKFSDQASTADGEASPESTTADNLTPAMEYSTLTGDKAPAGLEDTQPTRSRAQGLQVGVASDTIVDLNAAESATVTSPKQSVSKAPAWLSRETNEGLGPSTTPELSHVEQPAGIGEVDVNSDNMTMNHAEPAPNSQADISSDDSHGQHADEAIKLTAQGNAHFRRGALQQAIVAFNKAIQVAPHYGVPYSNLALTYVTQGQFTEAIMLYQRSIELLENERDRALSWNGLGNAYRCVGDYSNAIAAYQKAAELDPETGGIRDQADNFQPKGSQRTAKGWNDLGELLLKTGALDKANEAFQKAVEMEPDYGRAYCNLARTRAAETKYAEAIPYYEKGIALLETNNEKADAWNALGNAYRKLNDYNKAINAYQKAVVLADDGVDLLTRTRFSLLSNVHVNQ